MHECMIGDTDELVLPLPEHAIEQQQDQRTGLESDDEQETGADMLNDSNVSNMSAFDDDVQTASPKRKSEAKHTQKFESKLRSDRHKSGSKKRARRFWMYAGLATVVVGGIGAYLVKTENKSVTSLWNWIWAPKAAAASTGAATTGTTAASK
jgi:hypothetical protein